MNYIGVVLITGIIFKKSTERVIPFKYNNSIRKQEKLPIG